MNTTVRVSKEEKVEVIVTQQHIRKGKIRFLPSTSTFVTLDHSTVIIGYEPLATVETCMKKQPTVNIGLVYTSFITNDVEMWWCDNWKVLWNNKTRTLWQEE